MGCVVGFQQESLMYQRFRVRASILVLNNVDKEYLSLHVGMSTEWLAIVLFVSRGSSQWNPGYMPQENLLRDMLQATFSMAIMAFISCVTCTHFAIRRRTVMDGREGAVTQSRDEYHGVYK